MTRRLALSPDHDRQHSYCAYCPKLCRHSCPVATVESRETTTPWGKMTSLHHVAEGNLELDPAYAATWYACTGCMRCKTFCDHDNDVSAVLHAGRAEAVRKRVAPSAAYEVVERHAERQGRAARAADRLFGGRPEADASVVFVPGCTACVTRPGDAQSGRRLVEALLGAPVRVHGASCCGLPLLDAGDTEGFASAAERFLASLGGPEMVVFQDPGCLHALAVGAAEAGVAHDLSLLHLSQLAERHLDRLGQIPVEGPVRYHDACRLGRGLGVYDAPRKALERVLGRPPEELFMRREEAECSGSGGQLPRVFRETADAIADERLGDHGRAGGGLLVTACPGAAHRLAERPGAPEVVELATFLARAIPE